MGGDEEQDAEQRHEGGDQGRVHDGGGCGRAVREEVHHDLPERLLTPSPARDRMSTADIKLAMHSCCWTALFNPHTAL